MTNLLKLNSLWHSASERNISKTTVKGNRTRSHIQNLLDITNVDPTIFNVEKNKSQKHPPVKTFKLLFSGSSEDEQKQRNTTWINIILWVDILELNSLGTTTTRSAMQTQEGITIDKLNKTTVKLGNRTRNHNNLDIANVDAIMLNGGKNNSKKYSPVKVVKPGLFSGLSVDE